MVDTMQVIVDPQVKGNMLDQVDRKLDLMLKHMGLIERQGERTFTRIKGLTNQTTRATDTYNNKLKMTHDIFTGLTAGLLGYISAQQIFSGIDMAGEVAENNNKLSATFGNMEESMQNNINSMSKTLHLGKTDLQKYAGDIGSIWVGLDVTGGQLVKNTEEFMRGSLDAASFYNLSTERAFGAVRGAMLGESEALKAATGIIVQEDMMKSYAATLGVVWSQLDVSSKAQMRFNYIMSELKKRGAAGDLEKTADSFSNLGKEIGSITNEIKAGFFSHLVTELTPALKDTRDWLESNKEEIAKYGAMFGKATGFLVEHKEMILVAGGAILAYNAGMAIATVATNVMTAAQWALNIAMDANPVGIVIVSVLALVGAGVALYTQWGKITQATKILWNEFKENPLGDFIITMNKWLNPTVWLVRSLIWGFNQLKDIIGLASDEQAKMTGADIGVTTTSVMKNEAVTSDIEPTALDSSVLTNINRTSSNTTNINVKVDGNTVEAGVSQAQLTEKITALVKEHQQNELIALGVN